MTCAARRLTLIGCGLSALTALSALAALSVGTSAVAQPRTITLEDDKSRLWSKVANERAKANAAKSKGNFDDEESRCGNVEIGNVDTGKSRRPAPREVITVVTGDVINAPGRCK